MCSPFYYSQSDIDRAVEAALAEKERELALNAKMLAKQCDLARDAETKLAELREKVRRWKDATEKTYKASPFMGIYDSSHFELMEAELALRAAVEKGEDEAKWCDTHDGPWGSDKSCSVCFNAIAVVNNAPRRASTCPICRGEILINC